MKIFRKVLCMILAVMMMSTVLSAMVFAEEKNIIDSGYCGAEGDGSNLKWTLDSEGTLTISGTGAMKDYFIQYIEQYKYHITSAPWSKYVDRVKALAIEMGVTSIGSYAFYNCNGFTGSLVIPDSVTTIGDNSFSYCRGFDGNLVISNSVTSIGDNAFYDCNGFVGNLVIPDGVTLIGDSAFYSCNGFTGNLIIPDSVVSIGGYAFNGCDRLMGVLKIGSNVKSIGDSAFYGCNGFVGELIIPKSVISIGDNAFQDCIGFTGNLIIPDSVTSIGDSAFFGCRGFTGNLIISNGVISIGGGAFCGCENLSKDVIIPDSVKTVGDGAFLTYNFSGNLLLGSGVTSIGRGSFSCFKSIYFKGNAPAVYPASHVSNSFDTDASLYYIEGKSGWTSPTWNGYNTAKWDSESEPICKHINTEVRNEKAATCAAEGYTGDTYCKDCGKLIKNGNPIPKDPQNHVDETEIRNEKKATCGEKGYTGDVYCKGCGIKLANGEETEIDPNNHKFGEWKVVKESTKTEEGLKERVCSVCDKVETAKIPKLSDNTTAIHVSANTADKKEQNPNTGAESVIGVVALAAVCTGAYIVAKKRR